ncbi:hypothetical protein DERP_003380 [Dermatophagoides pteronyssinus]|uniref:Uncharacterized protein n=1 Tax=Dermatophagoides pteronyssinus TaxID=6956 RepID=A0ABQ8JJU5_DERPT|nr:hypothetical protein DERP_003380 [Dermatophagoides pteronyssinus]
MNDFDESLLMDIISIEFFSITLFDTSDLITFLSLVNDCVETNGSLINPGLKRSTMPLEFEQHYHLQLLIIQTFVVNVYRSYQDHNMPFYRSIPLQND